MVFNFNLSPSLSTEKLPVILNLLCRVVCALEPKNIRLLSAITELWKENYTCFNTLFLRATERNSLWNSFHMLEFTYITLKGKPTTENTRRVRNGWLEKIVIYAFREVEHCCWLCGNTLLCNVNTYHTSNTPNSVTDSFLQGSISVK